MKFDVKKFISGFNLLDGERFGKILYFAVLFSVGGLILWKLFIAPSHQSIQELDQRLNLQNATISSLTISTEQKEPQKTRFSLLSIRLFAKD